MNREPLRDVYVRILFFAKAREIVEKNEDKISVKELMSYEDLLNLVVSKYSLDLIKSNIILAVNEEFCTVGDTVNLKGGDEIAVIPPLSGAITELVTSPKCGAVSVFIGTTRDNFDGKSVVKLEYEAYESMAIKCMQKICSEIRSKWPVENIAIYHKLGTVPVKEASIVIAISSPHRAEAIQATQWCIDSVKESVPIWKKEIYDDAVNSPEWKENKECAWSKPVEL